MNLSKSLNVLSDMHFHLKDCINIQFHCSYHLKYQFVCKYMKKITMENLDSFGLIWRKKLDVYKKRFFHRGIEIHLKYQFVCKYMIKITMENLEEIWTYR